MTDINNLLRENIKRLVPYSSARDEFKGKEGIFLDANENSFGSPLDENYNRYPDPLQLKLKQKISELKNTPSENIFLGNGSDEAIDLLFRAFCEPAKDQVIICPPTYGMYEVSANINNVEVVKIPLIEETFQLDTAKILSAINKSTKLIFVCCPNNPTGNGVKWQDIKTLLENFTGIMVVDEAYIDFASYGGLIPELKNYSNLVILQTFSKAWGLAGLRVGMAFASPDIIMVFNKIKPPYNINSLSQEIVLKALENHKLVNVRIKEILFEREKLNEALKGLSFVLKIYPTQANFVMIKTTEPKAIYNYLVQHKIVIRDRSKVELCEGCLRITVGTKEENEKLINALKGYNA